MGLEIERKFIVNESFPYGEGRCPDYVEQRHITQGYMENGVRIRVSNGHFSDAAFLTIKTDRQGIVRDEFEYEIPVSDAWRMIELFCDEVIEKFRYIFVEEGKTWEVDVFEGENEGLILAEVELATEDSKITLPYFVGKEVSDDDRYYNKNLANNPYKKWKRLYTSYFNSGEWDSKNAVSIAGTSPPWYNGREYKKLAPKYDTFKKYKEDGDEEAYRYNYFLEVLDKLDTEEVYNDLGQDSVLLCWEKPGEFCHRHIVAKWFGDIVLQYRGCTKIEIQEIGESEND